MGPIWGPPGSCRPQMGPVLAPWTLLSGISPVRPVHHIGTSGVLSLRPTGSATHPIQCLDKSTPTYESGRLPISLLFLLVSSVKVIVFYYWLVLMCNCQFPSRSNCQTCQNKQSITLLFNQSLLLFVNSIKLWNRNARNGKYIFILSQNNSERRQLSR